MHSAQIGLAGYTYNGLLHPDPAARAIARDWWGRSIELASELGAGAAGGPLGALSVADAADPARRESLAARAARARSPSRRARRGGTASPGCWSSRRRCRARFRPRSRRASGCWPTCADTAVPLQLVIDVGHALYRPLYGEAVTLEEWLRPLAAHVGVLHLQNHDFRSDAHWGWPDARGSFDPQQLFAAADRLRARRPSGLPRAVHRLRAGRRRGAGAGRELRGRLPLTTLPHGRSHCSSSRTRPSCRTTPR